MYPYQHCTAVFCHEFLRIPPLPLLIKVLFGVVAQSMFLKVLVVLLAAIAGIRYVVSEWRPVVLSSASDTESDMPYQQHIVDTKSTANVLSWPS